MAYIPWLPKHDKCWAAYNRKKGAVLCEECTASWEKHIERHLKWGVIQSGIIFVGAVLLGICAIICLVRGF